MLIFNTTYKVATHRNDEWFKWMNESHIPFMLDSDIFSKPQIAKVVGSEDEGGLSFSVQFNVADMNTLMGWHKKNSTVFHRNCSVKFGNEVVFFSTVLELIDL